MFYFRRKRRRALVTRAAEFLGSHLVDRLIADGHDVIAVDDLRFGRLEHLAKAISTGYCTYVYGDLHDPTRSVRRIIEEARGFPLSKIFHLGDARIVDPIDGAAIELLDLAVQEGATFVYASIFDSDSNLSVRMKAECVLIEALRERGLDGRIFRVPNLLGSRNLSARPVDDTVDELLSLPTGPKKA